LIRHTVDNTQGLSLSTPPAQIQWRNTSKAEAAFETIPEPRATTAAAPLLPGVDAPGGGGGAADVGEGPPLPSLVSETNRPPLMLSPVELKQLFSVTGGTEEASSVKMISEHCFLSH
jgi:hypothetical protein